jgi:hypothetical protein
VLFFLFTGIILTSVEILGFVVGFDLADKGICVDGRLEVRAVLELIDETLEQAWKISTDRKYRICNNRKSLSSFSTPLNLKEVYPTFFIYHVIQRKDGRGVYNYQPF